VESASDTNNQHCKQPQSTWPCRIHYKTGFDWPIIRSRRPRQSCRSSSKMTLAKRSYGYLHYI